MVQLGNTHIKDKKEKNFYYTTKLQMHNGKT